AEHHAGRWHRGHRLEPRRHELLAQRDTAMMKTTLRTIGTGLKLALLAAASVLALELVYAHAVLDAPVRLEASIVALYAAVFALVGLAAGLAAAVFRRPAAVAPLAGAAPTLAGARLVAVTWFAPLAIVAASALGGPSRAAEGAATRPTIARPDAPPIIWVTIDTLRADHLSVYGYPVDTTPRLAEFAKTATVYTACGAQAPSTWQSVASLLSGLTPYRHGGVSEPRRLSDDLTLLPE